MPSFHVTAGVHNLNPPPAPLTIREVTLDRGRRPRLDEETIRPLLTDIPGVEIQAELFIAIQTLRLSVMDCVLSTEIEATDSGAAHERGRQAIEKVVMAIELVTGKPVTLAGTVVSPVALGGAVLFSMPRKDYSGGPASVGAAQAQAIEEIVTVLDTKPSKRVETALLEYDTMLKSDDVRRQFIHGVVALEALFGDERGAPSYKIPLRAAQLLPSLREHRFDGFGRLRKFYSLRNKFVHGIWDEDTFREAKGTVEDLLSLTAEAVQEFLFRIKDGLPTGFPDLDRQLFLS